MGSRCEFWFWVETSVRRRRSTTYDAHSRLVAEMRTTIEVLGSREAILLSSLEELEKGSNCWLLAMKIYAVKYSKASTASGQCLFSAEWTRDMDRHFITLLLQLKDEGFWTVGEKNERASARAIGMYNVMCGTNFDINFRLERVRKLHKRYKVFTWVIQRPWVTYDDTTHSVTCPDTVWKVLYDQQILVVPYIIEGEHSYASLKSLFQAVNEVGFDNTPIIQISSDTETFTEDDSSVMEIPNPYGSTLTGSHRSGGSSMNTDSIFYNELAWNYSDSETEESLKSNGCSTGMSGTNPNGKAAEGSATGRCGVSGKETKKGQSSYASWSPFKKK